MKPSEQRLLAAFVVVFAVVGGLVAASRLSAWQKKLELRKHKLGLDWTEFEATLADAGEWQERRAWLRENQPRAGSGLDADNLLFDRVLKLAEESKLTVLDKQYQPPVKEPLYHQSGVTLTVKGDLPSVFRWIYFLQSPSDFCTVPSLHITPDKLDPAQVECRVEFWRWYQPGLSKS